MIISNDKMTDFLGNYDVEVQQCPLCSSVSRRVFAKYEIPIFDCNVCGHRFAALAANPDHVAQVYSDDYFHGGEAGYNDYLSEAKLLRRAGKRYGELVKKFAPQPGLMLDVGAAAGFLMQGFQDAGWRVQGIEPNAKMTCFASSELALAIDNCSFEQYQTTQKFDLISLIQVIAHFQEPLEVFEKIKELTAKNGLLLIETWRRDSLTARVFGENWHEYSPPSVLHWFTKKNLESVLHKFGFEVIACGRPQKLINAAHAKSLLKYKLKEMPLGKVVAQSLRLIPNDLNLIYPAEDLFWLLARKIKD